MSEAQIRFEKSRKRLAEVLQNLEAVVMKKISAPNLDYDEAQVRLTEQEAAIENLNSEINKLQKTLFELGNESEQLEEKNITLEDKLNEFQTQGKILIAAIESDLGKIKEAIE